MRKLVTVRRIDALDPIEGRDLIEVATIEGWKVVVKKGEFRVGDPCVYFEIDSFLPDGNEAWQFLVDKSPRTFEGKKGHKLRTVKLGGQISQGLVLPVAALPTVLTAIMDRPLSEVRQLDMSELLGVVKYEAPLPAELAGQVEGAFPSFIPRTDEERVQNLKAEIFGYDDAVTPFSVDNLSSDVVDSLIAKGTIKEVQGPDGKEYVKVLPAKADRHARYEVTMKLDGSSMTAFHRDGEVGVCSRNLQLKVNDANKDNTFVRMLIDSGLQQALSALGNVAIQGELMGPGIQGNRENFKDFRFYVFNIFFIDEGRYATPEERREVFNRLGDLGVDTANKVFHVPVLHEAVTLEELGATSIDDLLKLAEGPSLNNPIREGLVFKRVDGKFSFKAISNAFLAKEKN